MSHAGIINRKSLTLYKEILSLNNELAKKVEQLEKFQYSITKKHNWEYSLTFEIALPMVEYDFLELFKKLNRVASFHSIPIFNVVTEEVESELFRVYLDTENRKMSFELIKRLEEFYNLYNIHYKK